MSKIEVNTVEPQCGTTLTLGGSGDTVALAGGASQTGFGRTGTVDWQTGDIKTGDFTAATGKGYFINTTSGTVTATLPASPTAGDIVGLKDYALTWDTNSCFIGRNGSPINGATGSTLEISTEGATIMLVYVDGVKGWIPTQDDASALIPINPTFVVATGGTPCSGAIVCTNYKTHTFTGPGTFCVSSLSCAAANNAVAYMVVAGGGGSGSNPYSGGGGAGGFREGTTAPAVPYTASPIVAATGITVTASPYTITVGGGGAGGGDSGRGSVGLDSSFSTITSTGGGGGGQYTPGPNAGTAGGSGGGGSSNAAAGGAGNTPPTSPAQGFPGGTGSGASGGGGGGVTAVGGAGSPGPRVGGTGATTQIPSSPITKSTGGDGAPSPATPVVGGCNTGDGGGENAGNGGSGIVVIRYKFQ